jgi:hypothetical protein
LLRQAIRSECARQVIRRDSFVRPGTEPRLRDFALAVRSGPVARRIAANIAKLPELVRKPWPFSGLDYRQPPGLTWP